MVASIVELSYVQWNCPLVLLASTSTFFCDGCQHSVCYSRIYLLEVWSICSFCLYFYYQSRVVTVALVHMCWCHSTCYGASMQWRRRTTATASCWSKKQEARSKQRPWHMLISSDILVQAKAHGDMQAERSLILISSDIWYPFQFIPYVHFITILETYSHTHSGNIHTLIPNRNCYNQFTSTLQPQTNQAEHRQILQRQRLQKKNQAQSCCRL